MPISDEAELKAHITAMLVVHGRTVPGEPFGMAVTRALTVQEAAELAVEIIQTSRGTYPRRR